MVSFFSLTSEFSQRNLQKMVGSTVTSVGELAEFIDYQETVFTLRWGHKSMKVVIFSYFFV